jgi:glycosyltransferase involved in cell wall biosynthesis
MPHISLKFWRDIRFSNALRAKCARKLRYNHPPMRVLMLSKALIVGPYQSKPASLAAKSDVELTVVVPPSWKDERGEVKLETKRTKDYELIVAPIRFNGRYHLHYYPTIAEIIRRAQPDILHLDEEPYNLATYHAARTARDIGSQAHILFFAWQNILRRYPPPFSWMQRYTFAESIAAIVGSLEAENILRQKGFAKPISVIPQFGIPESFSPAPLRDPQRPLTIGYAGRLVREKGIELLLRAVARVPGEWQLRIVGSGPLHHAVQSLASQLKIANRVQMQPWASAEEMPQFYQSLDILAVPSLTQPNWKEQFGRVIMEAMACGVPVIGSNSGEIPNVLGDAGIIVPEGDEIALARAIQDLAADPERRAALGAIGLSRAHTLFSRQRVADDTYTLYQRILKS